jgi:DNA-binding MarR family transcriptional regulator
MDDYPSVALERLKEMSDRYGSGVLQHVDRYSSGESFLLRLLDDSDEPMHPSELRKLGCVSSARVAATLRSLEKKGLVIRETDQHDRRRSLVTITTEGRQRAQREIEEITADITDGFTKLGKKDTEELVRILERLFEILVSSRAASDTDGQTAESNDPGADK